MSETSDSSFDVSSQSESETTTLTNFVCRVCSKVLESAKLLIRHMRTVHATERTLKCPICDKSFTRSSLLARHETTAHAGEKLYKCEICYEDFSVGETMMEHRRIHIDRGHYNAQTYQRWLGQNGGAKGPPKQTPKPSTKPSNSITKATKTSSKATSNIKSSSNVKPTNSKTKAVDSKVKTTNTKLKTETFKANPNGHLENLRTRNSGLISDVYKPYKLFKCDVCQKCCDSEALLQRHLKTHFDGTPYSCDECEYVFYANGDLLDHMKYHTGENPFLCRECGKSFNRKGFFTNHMLSLHGEIQPAKFDCDKCDQSFTYARMLNSHKRSAHGTRAHNCSYCQRSFLNQEDLEEHKKTHDKKELKFECTICSKAFEHMKSLTQHMRFHSREDSSNDDAPSEMQKIERFQCEECPRSFSNEDIFTRHVLAHANHKRKNKHQCLKCSKMFSNKRKLQNHARMHNQPYKCEACPKTFWTDEFLNRHMMKAHPVFSACRDWRPHNRDDESAGQDPIVIDLDEESMSNDASYKNIPAKNRLMDSECDLDDKVDENTFHIKKKSKQHQIAQSEEVTSGDDALQHGEESMEYESIRIKEDPLDPSDFGEPSTYCDHMGLITDTFIKVESREDRFHDENKPRISDVKDEASLLIDSQESDSQDGHLSFQMGSPITEHFKTEMYDDIFPAGIFDHGQFVDVKKELQYSSDSESGNPRLHNFHLEGLVNDDLKSEGRDSLFQCQSCLEQFTDEKTLTLHVSLHVKQDSEFGTQLLGLSSVFGPE